MVRRVGSLGKIFGDRLLDEHELVSVEQRPDQVAVVGSTTLAAAPQTSAGLIAPTPRDAAPALASNPGISDEQDFAAVSERETMESDAARRARNAANYEVVNATAVPNRDGTEGPNIVDFAIKAPNVKGQEWYSRSTLSGQGRFQRNCAKYRSPDAAQRDFLARGGPERDRLGIDLYLVALFAFGLRIFQNVALIRRHFL